MISQKTAAALALALTLIVPGAWAQDASTVRVKVYDPARVKQGMFFDRLNNIRKEDFADWGKEIQDISADMRAKIESQALPVNDYAPELITSWDALMAIEIQQQTILGVLQNAPPEMQNRQLGLAKHTQHNPDGTVTTLPLHIAQVLNVNIVQAARIRLGEIAEPLQLSARVTIASGGNCAPPQGGFDVVQHGTEIEISDGSHVRYFGAATDRDIWLWANVPRFATISTGKGLDVNAPDGPGLVFQMKPDGDGYTGTELGDQGCSATIHPAS